MTTIKLTASDLPKLQALRDQLEIPGCEDPARDLYAWLDAKDDQRRAADTSKIRHDKLLELLAARGIERYPYLERTSGKKRYVVADKTPKAKIVKPPAVRAPKRRREATPPEEQVEHRKVPRKSVEHELDPFAGTRSAMEER